MKTWIGREESVEFVLFDQWNMLLMRDENGKVAHEYFEVDIKGKQFELMHLIEGNNIQVKYKLLIGKAPIWVDKYILDKIKNDKEFFVKHFTMIKQEVRSEMIGKKVNFYHNNKKYEGVIKDKVCVPLATNPPRGYVEFDNYLIVTYNGSIFIVNPIDLNHVINE